MAGNFIKLHHMQDLIKCSTVPSEQMLPCRPQSLNGRQLHLADGFIASSSALSLVICAIGHISCSQCYLRSVILSSPILWM